MTSVISHWLSGKAFFFRYISAIPPGWSGGYLTPQQYTPLSSLFNRNLRALLSMHNQLFSPKPTLIFLDPPTLPTSHLSPHAYPHCLHFIKPSHIPAQPTSQLSPPTYQPTQPASHLSPHIYLHSLHLINSPTCTYTAFISFILPHIPTPPAFPHMYQHSLHLIYPPTYFYTACNSFIPLHIPTQPASHLFLRFNS